MYILETTLCATSTINEHKWFSAKYLLKSPLLHIIWPILENVVASFLSWCFYFLIVNFKNVFWGNCLGLMNHKVDSAFFGFLIKLIAICHKLLNKEFYFIYFEKMFTFYSFLGYFCINCHKKTKWSETLGWSIRYMGWLEWPWF